MNTDALTIFRGDVAQRYPIKRATWGFAEPTPYSISVFCLAIETEEQSSIFPEDDEWPHKPRWCLDIWARGLSDGMLLPGSKLLIPSCYDEFTGVVFTAFYYDDHEGTADNVVKIIRR